MSITQLQYFRAVCKFGSTVKAAEAMYVSQPSISSAINKLEEEFGITLFTRQNNRLVLTEDGQYFLERAERVLRNVEEFDAEFHRRSAKNEIHLSIPPVGNMTVSEQLQQYRASHPQLKIEAYEDAQSEALSQLIKGRRDFALTIIDDITVDTREDLEAIALGYVDLNLCVHRSSPLAALDEIQVDQIGSLPLVLMKDNYYQNLLLLGRFRKLGIEPNVILHAGLFTSLRKYVSMGYAAGFAFGSTGNEDDAIRYVRLTPPVASTFGIVYRKSALSNPNVRDLMDYLTANVTC